MTHIVHPLAHRLGIIRDWKSRWFGSGREKYTRFLKSDVLLVQYLTKRLRGLYIAGIEIERNEKMLRIIIKTSRPGMIIGRSGEGALKLRADLLKEAKRVKVFVPEQLKIDIEEMRYPEGNAAIVSQMIAEGLEKRMPFRRIMKQTLDKVMANRDVKGARIMVSGRLGGAEMSRKEQAKGGSIPLQTLRADVEFAREKAYLPYGVLGIKVWIYKGEVFDDQKNKK
ncbi:30S ribosomal protein S3 [Patescibacteria group bacterium]|nr:30S ribosomal protein S3 [Patescibacteria group bacterium]MBU1246357.1 30S ribosomal protein S3 [Patescibacteria group bacterium]MBU1519081.1 30S ribosomal protein S3 [Patescibacteria group bacterium]MBU1730149.1 30S ribosomal protein S3 [Patescibacteria group bacterium]MBU1956412.1 30S ribosomal protein S3 [Patescibacteria group bacterium]